MTEEKTLVASLRSTSRRITRLQNRMNRLLSKQVQLKDRLSRLEEMFTRMFTGKPGGP